MEFETKAIHAGQEPDPATGAVITPIYQTSTFAQEAVGVNKGYDYARVSNPTRTALEECLASLENAAHGHAFSSGVGATSTIVHLLDPGDHVVCVNDVYGGTYRMFSQVYEPKGYRFTYATPEQLSTDPATHLADARLVWIESPTNPLLNVVDIAAVAAAARAAGALLVVDNTFATPYLQTPLDLGADIVLHSTTKYLGGHSDVVGGFAATNDPTIAERLRFLQKSLGAVPGPFDAWLVLRGLKTLALRMDRHCENARSVVEFLTGHPRVTQVLWPGLPEHPGHEIAARQMRDFGGMVSFLVETEEEAVELVSRTAVWTLAESLGSVESLIEHPARMTHASTATGPFAAPTNLVRLSVGIESADDLVTDLQSALASTPARASRPRCPVWRAPGGAGSGVGAGHEPERRAGRVGSPREPTVGRVLGGRQDLPAELLDAPERGVDVLDREVDVPAGRLSRVIHDPGERSFTLAEGRVPEVVGVAHHVGVPAEHLAVEGDRLVVRARVQLEPRRGAGLAGQLEPLLSVRLPGADDRAARILDHRRAAVLRDLHRAHLHRAAVLGGGLRGARDVVGHEMDSPRIRVAQRPVVVHASGNRLAVLRVDEIPAEALLRRLRRPAEQLTVELRRLVGVGAVQVDPARGSDDERWCRHVSLPCRWSQQ